MNKIVPADSNVKPKPSKAPVPFRVLCIDGGGIRGLIPAIWLKNLDERLKAIPNAPELHECFQLVCGTSTGAIIAAAIGSGVSMDRVVQLYEDQGPNIFRKSAIRKIPGFSLLRAKYRHEELQHILEKSFQQRKLSEANTNVCITSYDIQNRIPVIFRSYGQNDRDNLLWMLCLASSSAPTYFPVYKAELTSGARYLVDGGVVANNPSGLGLAEAIRILRTNSLIEAKRPIQIISLGTGQNTRNLTKHLNGKQGIVRWASSFFDVMFDGSANISSYIAEKVLEDGAYKRLQFQLNAGLGSDDLDDASPDNIKQLRAAAVAHISDGGPGAATFEQIVAMFDPRKKKHA